MSDALPDANKSVICLHQGSFKKIHVAWYIQLYEGGPRLHLVVTFTPTGSCVDNSMTFSNVPFAFPNVPFAFPLSPLHGNDTSDLMNG